MKRDWSDGAIGLVGTVSSLVGIAVQAPAGATIDATQDKRVPLLVALLVLSVGPVLIGVSPRFWPILVGSLLIASIAGILSPAVSALTIASTQRRNLAWRLGRNAAFERGGNVVIAIAIGAIGYILPDRAVFLLVPALCVIAAAALFSIRKPTAAEPGTSPGRGLSGWKILLESRPLIVFALSVGVFHFANGPLLTLVAQDVSRGHPRWSSTVISICIVGAQAVMVPMALLVGRRADRWGRKPLLIVAFTALALRAILYCFWHNAFWLIGVQLIDGVGAGLLSAAKPLVVADIMEGTGRYNPALGLVGTIEGVGAALSFVIAGTLVQHAGFNVAYLASGGAALVALLILVVFMPETLSCSEGAVTWVPLTLALIKRAFEDAELIVLSTKRAIGRMRPYTLVPTLATFGHRSGSSSYPSGHAACGRVIAIILAAIVPAKAQALFARGERYGHNRLIAGTHFPSDLEAGGIAGSVIAAALFRSPRFRADLVKARTEAHAALGF